MLRPLFAPRLEALVLTLLLLPEFALGHDMLLVAPDHDVPAHTEIAVSLYNGTFDESLNVIDRDRMTDVSIVDGAGQTAHPDAAQWREEDLATVLDFRTGEPGTYVVGVSTAPRVIELTAEEFNEYLEHDGVLDVLEARRRDDRLDESAAERYAKHVKMLLTVGGKHSASYSTRLGYPVEIVPLANPATLAPGDALEILVLDHGEPAADQLVYASHEGFHRHADDGSHREAVTARTEGDGKASIALDVPGRWYVRLIRMLPAEDGEVDYVSNWATLTFEVHE